MIQDDRLKVKTVSGFFWQFGQKVIGQVLSFIVSVVLARLLMPDEYGIVALCAMFMAFVGLFVGSGLNIALIQKKNVDELDLNTIFISGLVLSVFFYLVVFFLSPSIAVLFENEQVSPVLRVMSLGMIISAFSGIQSAYVSRQLDFRKFFFSSLTGTLLSGVIGVTMAYMGFGVWALVAQNLLSVITNSIVLLLIVDWRPKWMFSWQRFLGMYSFAWKQIVANFTATFSEQLRGYVMGIKYSPADLAYYNRGDGIPGVIYNNFNGTINSVLFPALAKLQDDRETVKRALSRSMKISSYIIFPAMFGLAAMADKIVYILYTEKWLPAVPFMQLVCVIYAFSLIGGANVQALTAMGRSDVVMKLELFKRPIMISVLLFTMFISPLAIAIGQCVYCVFICFVNAYPNKRVLGYSIRAQIMDVLANFFVSIIMAIVVYLIGLLPMNIYCCFFSQILAGMIFYFCISKLTKNDSFMYLYSMLGEYLNKKFNVSIKNE